MQRRKSITQIQRIHELSVFSEHMTVYDKNGRTAMHGLARAARLNQSEKIYPLGSSGAPYGMVFSDVIACGPGSSLPTLPAASNSLGW